MTFNYMSYRIDEKKREKKMNRLKAALCNTHHNSTIETNVHGKMGKFPSQWKQRKRYFLASTLTLNTSNEIGLNVGLPLFSAYVLLLCVYS